MTKHLNLLVILNLFQDPSSNESKPCNWDAETSSA